jgi:hypothetical protein
VPTGLDALAHAGDLRAAAFAGSRMFGSALLGKLHGMHWRTYDITLPANNFTNGIIMANTGVDDDIRRLQTSVPIQTGNSGGRLLDQSGGCCFAACQ